MEPMLKAPVTQRLKQNYDKLLSNVAFNFNLRRYNEASLVKDIESLLGIGPT